MQFWALIVDSFRHTRDRKIFWVMIGISLLIATAMSLISFDEKGITIFFRWHYEAPQALLILSRMGKLDDPRTEDAIELVAGAQRDDGRWNKGPSWWRKPGSPGANVEAVDWGGRGPSEMVTLNSLRILAAAGRLSL